MPTDRFLTESGSYDTAGERPLVSVIIPTFNNESTISMCIRSVKDQSYDALEIIVVDNHSTDRTADIAEELGASVLMERGGRTYARNIGARHAKGDYHFHIDSDMLLDEDVINECVSLCAQGANMVIVPEVSIGEGYLANCRGLEKALLMNAPGYESSRFFEREAFYDVKGYDEHLEAGEDYDIHYRLEASGFTTGRANAMISHYEGRLSLQTVVKKSYQYGRSVGEFSEKHGPRLRGQQSVPQIYLEKSKLLIRSYKLLPGLFMMQFISFLLMGLPSRKAIMSSSRRPLDRI